MNEHEFPGESTPEPSDDERGSLPPSLNEEPMTEAIPKEVVSTDDDPRAEDSLINESVPGISAADQAASVNEKTEMPSRRPASTRFWVAIVGLASAFALTLGMLMGVLMTDQLRRATGMSASARIIAEARQSVVCIEVETPFGNGIGTGVIMTEDGYIATNHHVVENAVVVRVYFTDGASAEAEVIGSSDMDDLAVIKVDKKGLHPATFATAESYVGQRVYAIGHPGSTQLAWTTTEGVVSYVDRVMSIYNQDETLKKKMILLQFDADVNPGNSGGPVINENGEVVGIVSMRVEEMAHAEPGRGEQDVFYTGLGFALPTEGALDILNAIIRDGNADGVDSAISFGRPVVGINCRYVAEGERYTFTDGGILPEQWEKAPVSGVYVVNIPTGSPAEGVLQIGDILTEMNDQKLTGEKQFVSVINAAFPGDRATIMVYRNGAYQEVTVTLGEAP